ncbi:jg1072 [Pararge aegeria aegeria]|uniref:Jg1072 protein n=1 Tax=Pararge aegeria aegeria TaxID=348720 RepID=A0A8S4QCV9_9NEOP|nr:jg1072 [Pararge aegeria aegeria]
MCIAYLIFLLTLQSSIAERDRTPVFVIDYDNVLTNLPNKASPFMKMKSSDFSNIIEVAIERSKVVVLFVEETFSTEDISIKDKIGSPFYHLDQELREKKATYLPSVSQAFKTLKSHLQPLASYVFYLSDSSSKLRIYDKNLRHFYIYFKDGANETRSSALRRHDLLMQEVYLVVRQIAAGPVVAFYTGKVNPVVVETLKLVPTKTENVRPHPGVTIFSSGALFKFIG